MTVSIVRIGLAETKNFAEGYEAIFSKKKKAKQPQNRAKAKGSSKKKMRRYSRLTPATCGCMDLFRSLRSRS